MLINFALTRQTIASNLIAHNTIAMTRAKNVAKMRSSERKKTTHDGTARPERRGK